MDWSLDPPCSIQEMGPLEFAAALVPEPTYPAWRLHFKLIPVMNTDQVLSGYRVEASRINLSPAVYQEQVNSLGADNVDDQPE
ncbi:MAG: hypothetical protein R3E95_20600 [Thiolinea sp.]